MHRNSSLSIEFFVKLGEYFAAREDRSRRQRTPVRYYTQGNSLPVYCWQVDLVRVFVGQCLLAAAAERLP